MIKIGSPKLPEKFSVLRPQQDKAVTDLLGFGGRSLLQVAPTGLGKTLIYMTWALQPGRTVILTSTKALMDQIMSDFGNMGVVEIRGKDNYPCARGDSPTVKDAMCHFGVPCGLKQGGCPYYDAVKDARGANIVVTNYAFWLNNSMDTLGIFNRVVMDEAHDAPGHLANFLSVQVNVNDIARVLETSTDILKRYANLGRLIGLKSTIESLVEDWKEYPTLNFGRIRQATALLQAIECLERIVHHEVFYEQEGSTIYADPVHLQEFCKMYLTKGVEQDLLTSATATVKTAALLGLKSKVIEYPSPFPVENRPVIFLPTVKVDRSMGNFEITTWLARINAIIKSRLDRKGIVHVVSYDRAKLLTHGMYHDIIRTHTARTTAQAIRLFKKDKPPSVLVSPAITTGYDFPLTECEYQIIAKVPFPDSRRGIDQRRMKDDPELPFYLAWQAIVQAAGRGMREESDRCQTIIIDNHFEWLWNRYKHLAPKWFLASISRSKDLPPPLEKLP